MGLREDILSCRACSLWDTYKQNVPFEGNTEAELMFIGRDPGDVEVKLLRPFVGPAGQVFRQDILASVGIPEDQVYISNIVCCRPRGNVAPSRDLSWPCADRHVRRAIGEIQPKAIVTLGKEATEYALGYIIPSMGGTRGKLLYFKGTKIPVIPTWHPSYILRLQSINPAESELRRAQSCSDIKAALEYCEKLRSMV
jgi:uracil-DNA glycosylase family 4